MEKDTNSAKEFEAQIRDRIAPFKDVPILFISVLEKQRLMKVVETAMRVYENKTTHTQTTQTHTHTHTQKETQTSTHTNTKTHISE